MSTPDEATTSRPLSPRRRWRRSLLLAATAVALLGAGGLYLLIGSPVASAATQSGQPSSKTAPAATKDSQRWHAADADADVGPGQCEPCVVGGD